MNKYFAIGPCFLENKNFRGDLYKEISPLNAPNPQDCQKACQDDDNCQGIFINMGNGYCYLVGPLIGIRIDPGQKLSPKYCHEQGKF